MTNLEFVETKKEATFVIKQQIVYLEKAIVSAQEDKRNSFLVIVYKTKCDDAEWKKALLEISNLRKKIKGLIDVVYCTCLSVNCVVAVTNKNVEQLDQILRSLEDTRFYIFTILANKWPALLISECLNATMQLNPLYDESSTDISCHVSYLQNYLVSVVSRDRSEPIDQLLEEAIYNACLKYEMWS